MFGYDCNVFSRASLGELGDVVYDTGAETPGIFASRSRHLVDLGHLSVPLMFMSSEETICNISRH